MTSTAADPQTDQQTVPFVTAFRVVAIAEAISWGALLIAMLFKYVIADTAIGVRIVGPIHGTMFLAYVVMTIVVGLRCRWRPAIIILGLAAAIPPFTTVVFEIWADRSGRLRVP